MQCMRCAAASSVLMNRTVGGLSLHGWVWTHLSRGLIRDRYVCVYFLEYQKCYSAPSLSDASPNRSVWRFCLPRLSKQHRSTCANIVNILRNFHRPNCNKSGLYVWLQIALSVRRGGCILSPFIVFRFCFSRHK